MSNFLAKSDLSAGSYVPENLLAGDSDLITKPDTIAQAGAIVPFTVLGRVTASGKLIKSVRTAVDGSQSPVAILCEDVDSTAADVVAPVYVAGEFDIASLVWDASWATDAQKLAAFGDKATLIAKKIGFSG